MVNWTVEATAAMESLKGLQTKAGGYEGIGKKLSDSLTTAGEQASMSGKGGPIGIAISEFVDKWKDSLPGMVKHTGDVLKGTADALTALANGHEEMARIAQRGIQRTDGVSPRQVIRNAAAAAAPKPPRNAV
ncbi:hypothetical protein FB561_5620 [Kribbella amoyensis]|uniref:Uncharacterized protein n=1 Tax=Kribbella amoyensis TaxID=996641 RepID=A0A561BZX4_9ACTN|nr:DUF6507 family protein [Kribbella amoyensis]TWD84433.1 hypothetical protein FB561_5620 [Kribbella amoyensis]